MEKRKMSFCPVMSVGQWKKSQSPWGFEPKTLGSSECRILRSKVRFLKVTYFFLCSKLMRRQRNIFFPVISYNALYHYLNVGKTSSICWSWLGQRNFQQVWKSSLHQVGAEILLKILTTVCHTILMMLVGRIWHLINLWSLIGIFLYCLLLLDVVMIL